MSDLRAGVVRALRGHFGSDVELFLWIGSPTTRTGPAPADARYRHHPLFGFAGLAIPGERWRDLDRTFLRLKASFYSSEVARARTLEGIRPERWEPKTLRSRRDRRFAVRVMNLVQELGGSVFGFGCVKHTTPEDHSYDGLYQALSGERRRVRRKGRNVPASVYARLLSLEAAARGEPMP